MGWGLIKCDLHSTLFFQALAQTLDALFERLRYIITKTHAHIVLFLLLAGKQRARADINLVCPRLGAQTRGIHARKPHPEEEATLRQGVFGSGEVLEVC